ncbi:hypothetical protein DPEC_G00177860, partial [Dallia pectoralis]
MANLPSVFLLLVFARVVALPQMSSHPIIGRVGKSILLPCQLNSSITVDLQTLIFYWTAEPYNQVVHGFYNGKENNSYQDPFYRNRTQMFLDQISSGNFSFLLKDLKTNDDQKTFHLLYKQDDKDGQTIEQKKNVCSTDVKVAKSFP